MQCSACAARRFARYCCAGDRADRCAARRDGRDDAIIPHSSHRRTSFDKFNPYTIKGQSPAPLTIFMFETLGVVGADEPGTIYGLLAEAMLIASDKSSITFRIHPKARFNNGDPVTAEDVKYSF